jgi:hypothetical protein
MATAQMSLATRGCSPRLPSLPTSDLIVEAAGRAAVEQWGPMALGAAPEMIVAPTSAFCDGQLMERLMAIAEERGSRIVLPSGAIPLKPARRAARRRCCGCAHNDTSTMAHINTAEDDLGRAMLDFIANPRPPQSSCPPSMIALAGSTMHCSLRALADWREREPPLPSDTPAFR